MPRQVDCRENCLSELFAELGLMADLTRAVTDQGYTQPTPIQMESIPVVLDGRDVLAGAQTGTGKTAGFTLPLLQRLMENPRESASHAVRALIVTPTRELAAQIEESVRDYGKYLPLRSTVIFGGVGITPQIEALKEGVDILVATPGRLLDHANEQTVDLSQVEILVLDEADRMLDMGFIHDVKRILALLPARRQNLLFSATFSDEIQALADDLLDNPILIEVARRNAESELVAQRVHPVGQDRKRALLAHLVKSGDWKQVLVFTRTKHGANRLAHQLGRSGISATAIHGNKSQGARTKALGDFKAGLVRVLVATDLAARGLDIEELPHVVNYDLPHVAEDYVHRIGRTGRAGSTGEAISLVSPEEMPLLAEIEKLMGRKVEQTVIPGFEPGSEPPPRMGADGAAATDPAQPERRFRDDADAQPPREGGRQTPDGQAARDGGQGQGPSQGQGRGRRRNRGRNRNNPGLPRDGQMGGGAVEMTDAAGGTAAVAAGIDAPANIAAPQDAQQPPRQGQGQRHPPRDQPPRGNRNGEARRNNGQRGQGGQQGAHGANGANGANGGNASTGNNGRGGQNGHNVQSGQSGISRQEAMREERDNRGNRDTTNRNQRQVVRDDDFGNRIQPVKQARGIRARIAAGDIDDELDNIGNRMPPPPKHQHNFDSEDEFNFNIAPPAPALRMDDDDNWQPPSNAGQLFPSSAGFMGDVRPPRRGRSGNGSGTDQGANGNDRNRGNNKRRRGQQAQRQQPGQPRQQSGQPPRQGQPRQQRQHARGNAGNGAGQGRQEKRR
jgi:ATP-dependent RNA helicase RhlE